MVFGVEKFNFLKYIKHFNSRFFHFLSSESSVFWNKFFFPGSYFPRYNKSGILRKRKKVFRGLHFLKYKKFSRGGFLVFFKLRLKNLGFYFWKYKKWFLLRKYKKSLLLRKCRKKLFPWENFFVLGGRAWVRKFHLLNKRKYKKFFNIRVREFNFSKYKEFSLGWIFFIFWTWA